MSYRVGLTYNLKRLVPHPDGHNDNEAEFDTELTISAIQNAIEKLGHTVVRLEANVELPHRLVSSSVDMVFNYAEGINGRSRESQVPALLELLGIEYTGSDSTAMAICLDKVLAKKMVKMGSILTPNFVEIRTGSEKIPSQLRYPLIVKPACEGSSKGIFASSVVNNEVELRAAIKERVSKYNQPILVEEYIKGREFTVGMLAIDGKLTVMPPMEIVFMNKDDPTPVYEFSLKLSYNDHIRYDVPAQIDAIMRRKMERMAMKCFDVLGCRDVARVDLRVDDKGAIYFLECNPLPGLTPEWSDLCLISKGMGMSYDDLIGTVLKPATARLNRGVVSYAQHSSV